MLIEVGIVGVNVGVKVLVFVAVEVGGVVINVGLTVGDEVKAAVGGVGVFVRVAVAVGAVTLVPPPKLSRLVVGAAIGKSPI